MTPLIYKAQDLNGEWVEGVPLNNFLISDIWVEHYAGNNIYNFGANAKGINPETLTLGIILDKTKWWVGDRVEVKGKYIGKIIFKYAGFVIDYGDNFQSNPSHYLLGGYKPEDLKKLDE